MGTELKALVKSKIVMPVSVPRSRFGPI